jgi:D-alanine transfer protein
MQGKRFFLLHVLPFTFSVLVLYLLCYSPLQAFFLRWDEPVPTTPAALLRSFTSGNEDMDKEWTLRGALHTGSRIVVMGSSEMANTGSRAIPFNFFNDHGIHCLGIGHEGNQMLSMLVQLTAYHESLPKAKLVIILSPGWFEGESAKGTPLQTFLEYGDEHILYYIKNDTTIPQKVKDHIYDYVVDHFKDIDSPSSILREIYYQRSAERNKLLFPFYAPFAAMHKKYTDFKKLAMTFRSSKAFVKLKCEVNDQPDSTILHLNWDSLRFAALSGFKARSNNNTWGIDNDYYAQWMKGKEQRVIHAVEEKHNCEFSDFLILLELLKKSGCKPLFVMQPLNPLAFKNLDELDPILNRVEEELKKNGFPLLNLHTTDPSLYIKGTLNDYQHLGEAGWIMVDKGIYDHFIKKD